MLHFLLFLNRSLYWFYVYISFVFFAVCQIHQMFICNIYLTSWLLQVVVDAESRASCTPQKIKHSTRLLKRWVIFNMITTYMYKILKEFIIWGFFYQSFIHTVWDKYLCMILIGYFFIYVDIYRSVIYLYALMTQKKDWTNCKKCWGTLQKTIFNEFKTLCFVWNRITSQERLELAITSCC